MNYLLMKDIQNSERMGSQMMNLAALYAFSKKTGHRIALDSNSLVSRYPSSIIQETFEYNFHIIDDIDEIIYTSEYPYKEIENLNSNKNYYFYGLIHRSISVWSHIIEDIQDNFYNFKKNILLEAKNQIKFHRSNQKNINLTAVHFRRDDYARTGISLDLDYYVKALQFVSKDDIFLIFSDDIPWCKTIKDEIFEDRKVIFIENNKNNIDMCMMSLCHNNIIANSTFSIWSAALNKNKGIKISPMYGPGGCNLSLNFKNWFIV